MFTFFLDVSSFNLTDALRFIDKQFLSNFCKNLTMTYYIKTFNMKLKLTLINHMWIFKNKTKCYTRGSNESTGTKS